MMQVHPALYSSDSKVLPHYDSKHAQQPQYETIHDLANHSQSRGVILFDHESRFTNPQTESKTSVEQTHFFSTFNALKMAYCFPQTPQTFVDRRNLVKQC